MHVRTSGGVVLYSVRMIAYLPAAGVSSAQVDAMIQREVNRRRTKNDMPVDCTENVHGAHAGDNAGGRTMATALVPIDTPCASESQESNSDAWRSTRVGWKTCKESLETCHRSFLIRRIEHLEENLTNTKAELAVARRTAQQTIKRHKKLEVQLQDKKETNETILTIQKHQPKRQDDGDEGRSGRFTTRGFIALGIRKALAHTSAVAFPLAALVDVSRQTVTRAENATWSMLVARTGSFHALMRQKMRSLASVFANLRAKHDNNTHAGHRDGHAVAACSVLVQASCSQADRQVGGDYDTIVEQDLGFEVEFRDDVQKSIPSSDAGSWFGLGRNPSGGFDVDRMFCLAGTAFAGDATSSGIWRRSKLQGLFLTSACMTDSKRLESNTKYIEAFTFHTTVWLARQLHLLIVVVLWWS